MMESIDGTNEEKKDQYAWIIHNYEMVLWLEDNEKDKLLDDPKKRQEQVHAYFTKQFNKYVDPLREKEKPA